MFLNSKHLRPYFKKIRYSKSQKHIQFILNLCQFPEVQAQTMFSPFVPWLPKLGLAGFKTRITLGKAPRKWTDTRQGSGAPHQLRPVPLHPSSSPVCSRLSQPNLESSVSTRAAVWSVHGCARQMQRVGIPWVPPRLLVGLNLLARIWSKTAQLVGMVRSCIPFHQPFRLLWCGHPLCLQRGNYFILFCHTQCRSGIQGADCGEMCPRKIWLRSLEGQCTLSY